MTAPLRMGKLEIASLEARSRETPLAEEEMFRAGRNLLTVGSDKA